MVDDTQAFCEAGEAFLHKLIGNANVKKWTELRQQSQMHSMSDFVSWLLQLASSSIQQGVFLPREGQTTTAGVCDVPLQSIHAERIDCNPINTNSEMNNQVTYDVSTLINEAEHPKVKKRRQQEYHVSQFDNPPELESKSRPMLEAPQNTGNVVHEPEVDFGLYGLKTEAPVADAADQHNANVVNFPKEKRTTGKSFNCDKCDHMSPSLASMKAHMRTHSDQKPFHCTVCPFKAKVNSVIRRHMLTVHSTERPYVCDVCKVSYKRRDQLAKHAKSHTAQPPNNSTWDCVQCGIQFTTKLMHNKHVIEYHRTNPQ